MNSWEHACITFFSGPHRAAKYIGYHLRNVRIRVSHFRHKLFEMVGRAWIIDLHNISEHFAFWARSLTSLENVFLIFLALQCKIQGIFLAKKVVGHNFWTEGPTDLRSTFLSCIFDAFLGDTPLDHIFHICPYAHMPIMPIMGIWAYGHMWKIWSLTLTSGP